MGYNTRPMGSGAAPSSMAGYSPGVNFSAQLGSPMGQNAGAQPNAMTAYSPASLAQMSPAAASASFQGYRPPQQQGQLAMPPRPAMSTYSTPGAQPPTLGGQQPQMNAQQGMPPRLQPWQTGITAQQGQVQQQRLADGLSRM